MEIWKEIKETSGLYSVSNQGRVRNNKTGKEMKPSQYVNGYLAAQLMTMGKQKRYRIHRLVAEYFIPNPNKYPQVNHKDENKQNNDVNNLEWCTAKQNINYGTKIKRTAEKLGKQVYQYTPEGDFITQYPSISEAARAIGRNERNIRNSCDSTNRKCGGFIWRRSLI